MKEKTIWIAMALTVAFFVWCVAYLNGVIEGASVETSDTYTRAYESGVNAALDAIMLHDIEVKITSPTLQMTWGDRADAVRERLLKTPKVKGDEGQ